MMLRSNMFRRFGFLLALGGPMFCPAGESPERQIREMNQFQEYVLAQGEVYKIYVKKDDGVTTVTERAPDEEALTAQCREVTALAMQHLTDMRIREGAHLRDDLQVHLDAAAALREQIASRAPQVVEEYRLRLTERLARLPIEPVDPARLAQEVALMADKCAIDEELSRLESHIAQMHVYLDVSGETGKKMDFLIQEMNREANTIGSKCSDAQMAQNVVNLKSEIEKMREQIQNAV